MQTRSRSPCPSPRLLHRILRVLGRPFGVLGLGPESLDVAFRMCKSFSCRGSPAPVSTSTCPTCLVSHTLESPKGPCSLEYCDPCPKPQPARVHKALASLRPRSPNGTASADLFPSRGKGFRARVVWGSVVTSGTGTVHHLQAL